MVTRLLKLAQRLSRGSERAQREESALVKVLMVCRANICRSPMAEGALEHLLERSGLESMVYVDSAGTHSSQNGVPADQRGQQVAARRGISLKGLRSRRLQREDLDRFDYILAMDQQNHQDLLSLCATPSQREKIHLLLEFSPRDREPEIPDPYFGNLAGFERVMDLLEEGTQGVLAHIRERYRL